MNENPTRLRDDPDFFAHTGLQIDAWEVLLQDHDQVALQESLAARLVGIPTAASWPIRTVLVAALLVVSVIGSLMLMRPYEVEEVEAHADLQVRAEGASLAGGHGSEAGAVLELRGLSALILLAQRGELYRVSTPEGVEGWIGVDEVVPASLHGQEDQFDALYHPMEYVQITEASWQQQPGRDATLDTVFQITLNNPSAFPMTGMVVAIEQRGAEGAIEYVEVLVDGIIPAAGTTAIGTLRGPGGSMAVTEYSFREWAEYDADLESQYSLGFAVSAPEDLVSAGIDLVELGALESR